MTIKTRKNIHSPGTVCLMNKINKSKIRTKNFKLSLIVHFSLVP